jgi:hypothetical protein
MAGSRHGMCELAFRVPFQNLLVSQECLSEICHRLGFEEVCSWMRISGNTAVTIVVDWLHREPVLRMLIALHSMQV